MTATEEEISQQPQAWRQLTTSLGARQPDLRAFLDPIMERPDLRIVLTGAGSSAFAGELLAPALSRRLQRRVDAVATTDLVSNPRDAFAETMPTLLVSFARSGNSPESLAAADLADRLLPTVRHLVITCNPDGELARQHDQRPGSLVLMMPEITNDRGFAMTSSFTSMVLATWIVLSGSVIDPAVTERLAAAAEWVTAHRDDLRKLALAGYRRVVYLGSGPLRAAARESALKLLELTAGELISYHDSSLGFRHGPKSVLRDGTLVVVYVSNDPYTRQYDNDIVTEVRGALGSQNVLVLGGCSAADHAERIDWEIPGLDHDDDALVALPCLVAAQWLAYESSLALGLTPDNPFPNGEVNRVVQGVTIHRLP
jgi:tagatose-6-phosphate ketose/aldose isomerase